MSTLSLRSIFVAASLLALFLCSLVAGDHGEPKGNETKIEIVDDPRIGRPIVKGQLLVTLHDGIKEEALKPIFERMAAKFEVVGRVEAMNHYTLTTDHDRLAELRQRLANHPFVATASFNVVVTSRQGPPLKKPAFNDPVFKKPDGMLEDKDNWNLYRIKAPEAWGLTTGGVLIAIVDSGARLEHEELVNRTTNPWSYSANLDFRAGMKKGKAGDGSLYDFEVRNHGTHVAITAAGSANNGVGTAGVAPNSPIMPIQVLYYRPSPANDGTGSVGGSMADIVAGLERAINSGASVVNMSLGTYLSKDAIKRWKNAPTPQARQDIERELLPAVEDEVKAYSRVLDLANQRGVIVVAAAGNDDMPAHLYGLPLSRRVISVAAMTRDDKRWSDPDGYGSNFGPYTTVSAPGKEVYSGWAEPNKPYHYERGTSMAAPHVTGVVALMKTIDPELKLADVADILIKTGRPLTTDQPIGPLVDAKAALDEVRRRMPLRVREPAPPPLITPPVQDPTVTQLPIDGIEILRQPDPWNNPDVQRIIQVWLTIALPPAPAGSQPGQVWVYNRFGQVVNVRTSVGVARPIWFQFSFRWLWENSLTIESTNMGSLYEFVVGTLRTRSFDPAPVRVAEKVRPRPDDPKPPRAGGLPFDPNLTGTRWGGKNIKGETIEFDFGAKLVNISRAGKTLRYTVRINTYVQPATIDFYPEDGGDAIAGVVQLVGFGEILLRTDFTSKRPITISRGDPLTFVLRRADIVITNPGGTDDGVQMPILQRGIESLLVTYPIKTLPKGSQGPIWSLPEGFQLNQYALSKDGQRVWVLLHNAAGDFKGNRFQLWSMRTDGADAKQATFSLDPKIYQTPTVVTNRDGSIAWLFSRRPVPFQDYGHMQLQQVTPGGAAKVVLEAKDHKGITNGYDPRVTDDGRSLVFIAMEGIVRVTDSGTAHVDQPTKDIVYGDYTMPGTMERLANLAINADGSQWTASATFFVYKKAWQNAKVPAVVLVGSGKTSRAIYAADQKDALFDSLEMSADGRTVLMEKRNYNMLVWRDGHVKPIAPEYASVYNGVLAADGNAFYALNNYGGTSAFGLSGFVQDLNTGRRRLAISGFMRASIQKHGRGIQISNDGSIVTSVSNGMFEFGPSSLYVSRAGVAPPLDFPQIKSIRQRYEGGKLVVTVEASAEGPHRVFVVPLKNGYINPSYLVQQKQNPLSSWYANADGHGVEPLPKRPGFFQASADLGDKQGLLDDTYSLRIVVVNAGRNRATYQDVAVLR